MHELKSGRLMAVILCLFVGGAVPAAAEQAREEARRLMRAGEFARAADILRHAVDREPGDAVLRAKLAMALVEAGSHDEAWATIDAAEAMAREDAEIVRARALVLAARHAPARALDVVDRGLDRHAGHAGLLSARGRVLWQLKHTDSAIEALEEAAADEGVVAEARYWLGRIYFFRGFEAEGAFPGWHEEVSYRPVTLDAFRAAAEADPDWYLPHAWLGETLLALGRAEEALEAYDAAAARAPGSGLVRVGRWRALVVLGRSGEVAGEIETAAADGAAASLEAARQGYLLLGRQDEANRLGDRLVGDHPSSPGAQAVLAGRIAAARAARRGAEVVELARAFEAAFPFSEHLPDVHRALLDAYAADRAVPLEAVLEAIDTSVRVRPEPAPYFTGAAILNARREALDRAMAFAEAGSAASETFIRENLSSYRMDGKVQGAIARSRATGVDLSGRASYLQGDLPTAERKLVDAERLSSGEDMANQYHLGELARTKGELERAREHLLKALSLRGGAEAQRTAARDALVDVHGRLGGDVDGFERYLEAELTRRREQRQAEALRSMADQELPPLMLEGVDGRQVNLASLRGKVLLLNFFASW